MEKQEIENRRNAVKSIMNAALEGERTKRMIENKKVSIYYSEDEEWQSIIKFSNEITSKIDFEGLTLEGVSEYIHIHSGNVIDIDYVDLHRCKETENDRKYYYCLGDNDVLAYFDGKEDFSEHAPYNYMVAEVVLEKGIGVDELPDKLLFNVPFVDEYIKQSTKIINRIDIEKEGLEEEGISVDELPEKILFYAPYVAQYIKPALEIINTIDRKKELLEKGITPQDIEDASNCVRLGDFRESTSAIKEISKVEHEISTDDKVIDD